MKKRKERIEREKQVQALQNIRSVKKGYDLYWDHCFDGDRRFCAKQQGQGFG